MGYFWFEGFFGISYSFSTMFYDNKATTFIANNPHFNERTNYMKVYCQLLQMSFLLGRRLCTLSTQRYLHNCSYQRRGTIHSKLTIVLRRSVDILYIFFFVFGLVPYCIFYLCQTTMLFIERKACNIFLTTVGEYISISIRYI